LVQLLFRQLLVIFQLHQRLSVQPLHLRPLLFVDLQPVRLVLLARPLLEVNLYLLLRPDSALLLRSCACIAPTEFASPPSVFAVQISPRNSLSRGSKMLTVPSKMIKYLSPLLQIQTRSLLLCIGNTQTAAQSLLKIVCRTLILRRMGDS